jgi:hypothetical protein
MDHAIGKPGISQMNFANGAANYAAWAPTGATSSRETYKLSHIPACNLRSKVQEQSRIPHLTVYNTMVERNIGQANSLGATSAYIIGRKAAEGILAANYPVRVTVDNWEFFYTVVALKLSASFTHCRYPKSPSRRRYFRQLTRMRT